MAFKVNGLKFTPKEAELLISSSDDLSASAAGFDEDTIIAVKKDRNIIAGRLAEFYAEGDKKQGVTRDLYKKDKYEKMAASENVVAPQDQHQVKPKGTVADIKVAALREPPKETNADLKVEASREIPKATGTNAIVEVPQETPVEVPQETPKAEVTNTKPEASKETVTNPTTGVSGWFTSISNWVTSISNWFTSENGFKLFLKTAIAYEVLGWLTSIRLAILRGQRLTNLANLFSKFLSDVTKYGGLSYLVELFVEGGVIARAMIPQGSIPFLRSFGCNKEEQKANPDWASRGWNTFKKDERPARTANALVWFAVNLTCLFITGGASIILNTVLFGFDIAVDFYKWVRDWYYHHNLIKKLDNRIFSLEETLHPEKLTTERKDDIRSKIEKYKLQLELQQNKDNEKLNKKLNKKIALLEIKLNLRALTTEEKTAIDNEIQGRKLEKLQVENQQKDNSRLKFYLLTVTTIIFVGMAIIYFPVLPTLIVGGSLLACMGIGAGTYELNRKPNAIYNGKKSEEYLKKEAGNKKSYLFAAAALTLVAFSVIGLSFFPPAALIVGSILTFMGCTFAGLGRRMYRQVDENAQKEDKNIRRLYVFAAVAIVVIGLAFTFFPPAPAAILATSVFAVTASVFVDLGSRLYYAKVRPFLSSKFPSRFPKLSEEVKSTVTAEPQKTPAPLLSAKASLGLGSNSEMTPLMGPQKAGSSAIQSSLEGQQSEVAEEEKRKLRVVTTPKGSDQVDFSPTNSPGSQSDSKGSTASLSSLEGSPSGTPTAANPPNAMLAVYREMGMVANKPDDKSEQVEKDQKDEKYETDTFVSKTLSPKFDLNPAGQFKNTVVFFKTLETQGSHDKKSPDRDKKTHELPHNQKQVVLTAGAMTSTS